MPRAGGIRAGKGFVELYLDRSRLVRGLKSAGANLKAFGAKLRAIGLKGLAAGGLIVAPMLAAAKVFATAGDQLHKMSARTGVAVESLSELEHAATQSGSSLAGVEKGIKGTQKVIRDAGNGLTTTTRALDDLGLSVENLQGLSPEDQFTLLADRIGSVEDPTARAGIAMDLLGKKVGTELLPMFAAGAGGISALRKEARDAGLVMTKDMADKAAQLTDAMSLLKRMLRFVAINIGSALAPILIKVAMKIATVSKNTMDWIKANGPLLRTIFKVGLAVLAGGAALVLLGTGFGLAGAAVGGLVTLLGVVGAVLGAILSPIGLVVGGLVGLTAWFLTSTKTGGATLDWLMDKFGELKDDALQAFDGIRDALAAGDIKAAANILWLGLQVQWRKGVHALNSVWIGAKSFFMDTWRGAIFAVSGFFTDLVAGIEASWISSIDFLADAWSMFTTTITKTFNRAVGFVEKQWAGLKFLADDTFDVVAEVKRINDDVAAKNETADTGLAGTLNARGDARAAKLAEIEQARQGAREELRDEAAREKAARDAAFARELEGTAAALVDARRNFDASTADAKKKRAALAGEDGGDSLLDKLGGLLDGVGATAAGQAGPVKALEVGTEEAFAFLVRAMGGGAGQTADEKTAAATKKSAGLLEKMKNTLTNIDSNTAKKPKVAEL